MALTRITSETGTSQPSWLTVLRILLGIILIWKGVIFTRDTAQLESMIEQTGVGVFSQSSALIASVVIFLVLLCGLFIAVGFFTRISAIVQIPILIVAMIFVNLKNIERNGFELILTIIVLVLLVLFAIKGSGPLSADEYFRRGAAFDKKAGNVRKNSI